MATFHCFYISTKFVNLTEEGKELDIINKSLRYSIEIVFSSIQFRNGQKLKIIDFFCIFLIFFFMYKILFFFSFFSIHQTINNPLKRYIRRNNCVLQNEEHQELALMMLKSCFFYLYFFFLNFYVSQFFIVEFRIFFLAIYLDAGNYYFKKFHFTKKFSINIQVKN